jgi:hypothetical protein
MGLGMAAGAQRLSVTGGVGAGGGVGGGSPSGRGGLGVLGAEGAARRRRQASAGAGLRSMGACRRGGVPVRVSRRSMASFIRQAMER